MADISNPKLLYFKGLLMLLTGIGASSILILENANWRFAALLCVAIWGFCRAYYFAFYVIEHYVDGKFKFAGLWAFLRYFAGRRNKQ